MRMRLVGTIGATVAAACLAPAGASATTVTMGSPLVHQDDEGVSGGANTVSTQLSFDAAISTNPTTSPANGVITGWKVRSMDDDAIYSLKVLHANGPIPSVAMVNTSFTAVRSVQAPSAVPAGTSVSFPQGAIFAYPASLPISKGDFIGILTGGADDGLPQFSANGFNGSLIANNFTAQPTDGSAANLLSDVQHELLLQATVKFCKVPDLVGKPRADATAAIAGDPDCTLGAVTEQPFVFKKKGHGKKAKRKLAAARAKDGTVASSTPAAGETGAPGLKVDLVVNKLQIKKKKKK